MPAESTKVKKSVSAFYMAMKSLANSLFWLLLFLLAVLGACISFFIVSRAAREERLQMLFSMHARAESLIWAIEGGARFLSDGHGSALPSLFVEMARQPGIAWLALVDRDGRILVDSSAQLVGSQLYTSGEMAKLAADYTVKGRFSPDDPNIYETWKIFNPARLRGHKARFLWPLSGESYIFVAMDAADFNQSLDEYVWHLSIIAALIIIATLTCMAFVFLAYNLRSSRRKLADAQALASQVIQNYPAPLLVTDTDGRINICNAPGRRLLGLGKLEKNASHEELCCMDWLGISQELNENVPVVDRECELTFSKDRRVPVKLTAARVFDANGRVAGYLFVLRDLAEIDLLKKKLRQSERLSALGKLASGLAHEIRNPLSSICGYACYLEQRLAADPMGTATARLLVEEAQRLNGVLADLLCLARPPELRLSRQPLRDILQKAFLLALPDAKAAGLELTLSVPPKSQDEVLPDVDADRLKQALLNLLLNAIQATPKGGKVDLSLEFVRNSAAGSGDNSWPFSGPLWRIKVEDNGKGMSEKALNQIFTPYFTTKANGTGLGLAITREIIESHGGAIFASSLPGRGSVFTIIIPARDSDLHER